ncbi:type II toxin-antitoxin system HicB family antitoxin [Amnibacterium kyonggiense]|uniref:type II toxin-antitoxin system HicB family antitoxin n=1 Tax=Amnibacterium kyonggiense TaxID=595671 RepID=UPI00105C540C|nr:hypothetical protein [Amnibacterium kyonggiense]
MWIADVVDLPGAHTFAATREELPALVEEVVRLVADLPDDAVIELHFSDEAEEREWRLGDPIPRDFTVVEVDLDEEEIYLPDGRRLTEQLADELGERYASPHADPDEIEPGPR